MIRKITPKIYLSGQNEVEDQSVLMAHGITAVLNVADNCNDHLYNGLEFAQIKIGLMDNTQNPVFLKDMAVQALKVLIDNGHTVLVHCVSGASRSPYVIFRYLAETEHRTMDAIYKEFITQYPDAGITISPLNYAN